MEYWIFTDIFFPVLIYGKISWAGHSSAANPQLYGEIRKNAPALSGIRNRDPAVSTA
jgi:hypothetical protein